MNELIINKDYRVASDGNQFILRRRGVVRDEESKNYGNEYWSDDGYFVTLGSLFKKLGNKILMDNLGNVRKALKEIESLKQRVDDILVFAETT